MTNLFLAVIMENFVYLTNDISTLDSRHIHRYKALWGVFDRKASGHIHTDDLVQLMKVLEPPLGCGLLSPARVIFGKILRLKVPVEKGNLVGFSELLLSLVMDSLHIDASNNAIRDDIEVLLPNCDEQILDRIIPLNYDPRVLNRHEKLFYQTCAVYVIGGYYKMYKSGLRVIRKKVGQKQNVLKTYFEYSTSVAIPSYAETEVRLFPPTEEDNINENEDGNNENSSKIMDVLSSHVEVDINLNINLPNPQYVYKRYL